MKPKSMLLIVLALAAGTGALIQHREPMLLALGLEAWDPTYMRAVDHAKSARSLQRYHTNYFTIKNRLMLEGGAIDPKGWIAERVDEDTFLVRYRSTVRGRPVEYDFEVDVAFREVFVRLADPKRPDYDPNDVVDEPPERDEEASGATDPKPGDAPPKPGR